MFLNKRHNKKINHTIGIQESGFEVRHNTGISIVKWTSIEKIVAYKVDILTTDDICLEIGYLDKYLLITEECKGWRNFLSELINQIPTIDPNWEEKIIKPPFERNETELYNRIKTLGNNI